MRHTNHLPVALAAALSSLALSCPAKATVYYATGAVEKIFSGDRVQTGANDSFLIDGFSSAGSCPTNDGLIGLAVRDDEGGRRQIAILLSAKIAGLPVSIRVDDAFKNSAGTCYVMLVEFH